MNKFVELSCVKKQIDEFQLGPIDFSIEHGTVTALVGDNGSGKSTLLKIMMNLVNLDSGNIQLFNESIDYSNENWKKEVAYQPQTSIGYDAFTGEELKTLISNWYPKWDNSQFEKIVSLLNIPLNKRFGKLSQGLQQKLMLALTIARNTKLLILDEPTSFIDIPSKKILMDLLVEWMDEGERAILFSSHQTEDIRKLADYIVLMQNGDMIGHYEKEVLIEGYRRYWIPNLHVNQNIPRKISVDQNAIISDNPTETEEFLRKSNIDFTSTSIELDEIITILLTNNMMKRSKNTLS